MIAERRVELHAGIEQRLVRLFELRSIVFLAGRSFVDVVAGHQHELVVEALAIRHHLGRDFVLRLVAAAAVADNRELDRAVGVGQRELIAPDIGEPRRLDLGPFLRLAGLGDFAVAAPGEEGDLKEDKQATHDESCRCTICTNPLCSRRVKLGSRRPMQMS